MAYLKWGPATDWFLLFTPTCIHWMSLQKLLSIFTAVWCSRGLNMPRFISWFIPMLASSESLMSTMKRTKIINHIKQLNVCWKLLSLVYSCRPQPLWPCLESCVYNYIGGDGLQIEYAFIIRHWQMNETYWKLIIFQNLQNWKASYMLEIVRLWHQHSFR